MLVENVTVEYISSLYGNADYTTLKEVYEGAWAHKEKQVKSMSEFLSNQNTYDMPYDEVDNESWCIYKRLSTEISHTVKILSIAKYYMDKI